MDPSGVEGTGSGGRILVKDVEAAADGSRVPDGQTLYEKGPDHP